MRRLLTALVLAPAVLYIVLLPQYKPLFFLVAAVAALCYYEFGGLARLRVPEIGLGIAAGTLLLYVRAETALLTVTFMVLLFLVLALRFHNLSEVLPVASAQAIGLLYIYGAWNTALFLHDIGPYWLVFGLAVNWVGDTGAYYVGRAFGRHKLAPRVSPGKSWEGAIASVCASVAFGIVFLHYLIPTVKPWQIVLISVVANVAGQVGDLVESAMKRGAGVKDSGTLLPGHGGWLDRVDSSLFSLPVLYGFLYFFGI
jgi:phosphatidate cytidylyltransferase